jgi:diguanylate cyclase (GGDEF)-like protein
MEPRARYRASAVVAALAAAACVVAVGLLSLVAASATVAAVAAILAIALAAAGVVVDRRVGAPLRRVADTVDRLHGGDLTARTGIDAGGVAGVLGRHVDELAESLGGLVLEVEESRRRAELRRELQAGLELVVDEAEALTVAGTALGTIAPAAEAELLLADFRDGSVHRAAESEAGAPGCSVAAFTECVALRRDATAVFASSRSLDACPRLRERPGAHRSAVCAPVRFMGQPFGVVHVTGPDGVAPAGGLVDELEQLAERVGSRIGTLRALQRPAADELTTDPLTGLLTRPAFEQRARELTRAVTPFALVIADIDHITSLNAEHGAECGDRALQLFAQVLRSTIRGADVVARFGGEEFALLFPRTGVDEAVRLLERLQFALAGALAGGEVPPFTASFGVAAHPAQGSLDAVVLAADVALLDAKAAGRNRIVVASAGDDEPDES